MNDYLVLITPELGCAYRWKGGELEVCSLMADGSLPLTDWGCIEEWVVGEEEVTFRGMDVALSQVYRYVEKLLKPKEK